MWQDLGRQHAQTIDDRPRVIEPVHVRIAGGKPTVGPWPCGRLLDGRKQLGRCFVETTAEKLGDADNPEVIANAPERAETECSRYLLECAIWLSRPDTERGPQEPSPRKALIERKSAIKHVDLGDDILAEDRQGKS